MNNINNNDNNNNNNSSSNITDNINNNDTTSNKMTIIIIAHRLSTILNSNKIYVIDSGNVIADGKHEELLEKSSVYKNFYEKQIQK